MSVSNFFGETTPKPLFQHQGRINKKLREKESQETIVTTGASRLVSQTKIAYSYRPNFLTLVRRKCLIYCSC